MPPLQINHNCCYKCGDLLDDIFCQQCTCKSCGNGAHIGYNCPPKAPINSNPEQYNQTINELPRTLPSVHPTCNYEDENSFTYDSKLNSFNDSPSVLTHPPQLQFETYLCELCGNNAHYGYDCPPQFPLVYERSVFPVNYPPQETSREILQAREDLMETIQAFLKEEEQNNMKLRQDLLIKLMDDLQILKGSQQEKKETAAQSFIPYWNSSMIDDEEARDNFLKDVCTFLRKFSRIPFGVTPKVILIAWEGFGKIKDALMDKQLSDNGLLRIDDVKSLKMCELSVKSVQNRLIVQVDLIPLFYFDDVDDEYTIIWRGIKLGITPDEPSEEPEDPLIMGEKELSTIPEKDKSSIGDLVPIPSGSKGVSNDIYDHSDAESLLSQDIPITSPKIDFLSEEFAGEFAPIPPGIDEDEFDEEEVDCYDHDISSDDDSYENIEYVEASPLSLEYDSFEEENEDQEEKEFDLEDIFKSRCYSSSRNLIEPDQGGLTGVVISDNSNDPLLELPEFESFHFDFDPSFPRPPPEPSDVEISLIIETDAHVINDFGELNEDEYFDPGGGTDKAKITRKRSKPDKHEHGNGRARKEPEVFYKKVKKSAVVNPQSTLGQSHNKTKIPKLPNSPS
ncbi:hypothetical protein Tco_0562124 [Tanacetum coccineum]